MQQRLGLASRQWLFVSRQRQLELFVSRQQQLQQLFVSRQQLELELFVQRQQRQQLEPGLSVRRRLDFSVWTLWQRTLLPPHQEHSHLKVMKNNTSSMVASFQSW
jgi:hypothetical protein